MTVGIDACLEEIAGGLYDIQLDSAGDIQSQDFFDTALLVSLFAERRANESEVLESRLRRGWIGNECTPGFEIGSKLWLFEQSRLTGSTINGVSSVLLEALRWFIDDGFLESIDGVNPIVTTHGLSAEITLRRPNSQVEKRFFVLWDNTAIPCPDLPNYFQITPPSTSETVFEFLGSPSRPVDVVINVDEVFTRAGMSAIDIGGPWHPDTTILINVVGNGVIVGGGGDGGAGGSTAGGGGQLGGGGGGGAPFGKGGASSDGAHDGGDAVLLAVRS
jgi:phage gp46-like protein